MNILNFDKSAVINYDYVADIHIRDNDIVFDYSDTTHVRGGACCAGEYKRKEYCKYALEMFFAAIRNHEETFQFPTDADIEERMKIAKQASISVKTKGNLHGGS